MSYMCHSELISLFIDTARKAGATIEEIHVSDEVLCDSLLEIAGGLFPYQDIDNKLKCSVYS